MISSSIRCWSTGIARRLDDEHVRARGSIPRSGSTSRRSRTSSASRAELACRSARRSRCARSGFERPANEHQPLFGASADRAPDHELGLAVSGPPSPGSVCSTVPLSTAPFLVHLSRRRIRPERCRYILCDHGAGRSPDVVADRHRGDEHRVDRDACVPTDHRPLLWHAGVIEVRRDRSRRRCSFQLRPPRRRNS